MRLQWNRKIQLNIQGWIPICTPMLSYLLQLNNNVIYDPTTCRYSHKPKIHCWIKSI